MGKITFKPGTMLNPVPAVLVSCGSMESANLITIGWTGVVNTEPPLVYISVRKSRYSHQIISETREFVINLTTTSLVKATDFCGVKSGRDLDKFRETGLTPIPADQVACPMVLESPVNLECRVTDIQSFGTHDMFLAEVVSVHADEALMDENGKLRLDLAKLISYSHGEYFSLSPKPLGSFGYSIMKPKTKKKRRQIELGKKQTGQPEEKRRNGKQNKTGRSGAHSRKPVKNGIRKGK